MKKAGILHKRYEIIADLSGGELKKMLISDKYFLKKYRLSYGWTYIIAWLFEFLNINKDYEGIESSFNNYWDIVSTI